ncbi:alpha/beta fold hydrolase [Amycolatopsis aidingensis]|uniref:alpha/beta fold hydrolase n=1 Tax=Amycolatopsis aidingensis TaxID=2842453 RepID=UPI001C0B3BEA|nr:alpha/beta hydrolase [Amycolatopsis aidingensis]
MPETLTPSTTAPQARSGGRAPLTRVPLSNTPLPPLGSANTAWPGGFEDAGGVQLHVRRAPRTEGDPEQGTATDTAVYVHGLGGSSTNWTDLGCLLAPFAPGIALDLPGFGFSEPQPGFDFSLDAHTETLRAYLAGLDAGPVHLVGNSMGGAISLLLAARYPELVRTLTLVSPAMPDRRPDPRRLSDPRMALAYLPFIGKPVRRRLAQLGPRERAMQVINLCFADPSVFPDYRLDELAEEHGARAGFSWAAPALARSTMGIFRTWFSSGPASLWAVAPAVGVPTLVVWGTGDRVISVRRAVRTARLLPRARLLVLPRTGHVAQMERPRTVARAVLGMWEHVREDLW